jgi:hypothetical protein
VDGKARRVLVDEEEREQEEGIEKYKGIFLVEGGVGPEEPFMYK